MSSCIAVINAGSSSVKFPLYDASRDANVLFRGQIEGIGVSPRLTVRDAQGGTVMERVWSANGFDHDTATREILSTGARLASGTPVEGIGHRVVHGGMEFSVSIRLNRDLLDTLAQLEPLAPLHQPHNLAPIRTIFDAAPHLAQEACFDTAFHRGQSHVAQSFALPRRFSDAGIRRYGFHGLSYEYLVSRLHDLCPQLVSGRVIFAQLGNGASLCAVYQGRSVASTMGFTAVDGLMMGTRCGSLDVGVLLYLLREYQMDTAAIEDLIYRQSGMLGVSGISPDMRTLRASSDPAAREAIDLFVYRIIRETGSLIAALGGIDALVFSGGIGENDAATPMEVVEGCRWTGAILDPQRNATGEGCISAHTSAIPVWVIPTVDGGADPRKSGDDRKSGTRFAALDQPLLAISRSDANGCSVALCQRRQPPKAGAVGQRLQRVAGQPSLTIKSDGWSSIAAVPTGPRAALCERRSRLRNGLCAVYARFLAAANIPTDEERLIARHTMRVLG